MKTIKERAEEFAEREYYVGSYERERIAFGYYHGATEQHKIDIEKASEWLENAFNGDNIEGCKDSKQLIEDFKKAMEL